MAGLNFSITIDDQDVRRALNKLLDKGGSLRPAFIDIGEYLITSHEQRFADQHGPDGQPWKPLSEEYRAHKKRHQDMILVLNEYLADSFRYEASDQKLEFGTDRVYAAVHQFGFTDKNIPARPFLGVSDADEEEIIAILKDHLTGR